MAAPPVGVHQPPKLREVVAVLGVEPQGQGVLHQLHRANVVAHRRVPHQLLHVGVLLRLVELPPRRQRLLQVVGQLLVVHVARGGSTYGDSSRMFTSTASLLMVPYVCRMVTIVIIKMTTRNNLVLDNP